MNTDLVKANLAPGDILRWAKPETEDEALLFGALRQAGEKLSVMSDQLDELRDHIKELEKDLATSQDHLNERDGDVDRVERHNDALLMEIDQLKGRLNDQETA